MRRALLTVGVLCAAAASCSRDAVRAPAPTAFNGQPTLLNTLPAGYEAGEVTFSDDGFQAAVVLKKDGAEFLSVNSALSAGYESVRAPVFHAGSKQHAFVARRGGKECVVSNGREGAFFDAIEKPILTTDGRLVYAARRKDKWFIVAGDKVSQPFESPGPSLHASPDGKRLAFVERNGATGRLSLRACSSELGGCSRGREFDAISEVAGNPSGSHLAYRVDEDGRQTIAVFEFGRSGCTEKVGRWYEGVGRHALSANGEHVAFFGRRGGVEHLVSAGSEWPCANYKMVFELSVSDEGNVLYTGVIEDSIILSRDGKVIDDRHESIDSLTFSSDSRHSLIVAGPCPLIPVASPREFAYLVIDGRASRTYDKIVGPRFSPGGAQVVFRARAAGRRFLVVADLAGKILREHPAYDAVWDYRFSPDGKSVGYGVRSGRELWWKVESLG